MTQNKSQLIAVFTMAEVHSLLLNELKQSNFAVKMVTACLKLFFYEILVIQVKNKVEKELNISSSKLIK